jgi:folate-binding protein YgfZ
MNSNSGHLPYLGVLRFTGPDAFTFLQGQISNDSRRLMDGRPLLAAYSSPQGRVLAVLHLLPHAGGAIALLPRELIEPVRERLRKYVLRSKLRIDGPKMLNAAGIALPETAHYLETDGVGVAGVAGDAGRYWVTGLATRLAAAGLMGDAHAAQDIEQDWRLADIRAGLPQVYPATTELFVAQMLNLDLVDGISFAKGCYTGQEIITRTQHLGRIKRRMHRLQLPPGNYLVGQALRLTDGRGGRLVEIARVDGEATAYEALAVLHAGAAASDADQGAETDTSAAAAGAMAGTSGSTATGATVAAVELPLPYAVTTAT